MVHLAVPGHLVPLPPGRREEDGRQHGGGVLMIHFYKPPPKDPLVNRVVAWFDGPFSHVEVGFEDGMTSSIFSGERVFMHYRRLANPNYTTVSIGVTPNQVAMARAFCEQRARDGEGFDGLGMYTSAMPRTIRWLATWGRGRGTFCSKYVTEVLQHIGVGGFEGVDPSGMSPSMVHRRVLSGCRLLGGGEVLCVTPYRRDLLSSHGVV